MTDIFKFYKGEIQISGIFIDELKKTGYIPEPIFFPVDISKETKRLFQDDLRARKNVIAVAQRILNIIGYDFGKKDVEETGEHDILINSEYYDSLTCLMLFLEKIGLRKASSLFLLALCKSYHNNPEIKREMAKTGIISRWMGIFSYLSDVCPFTGLKYTGNSCYQDSVLLALFAIPNNYIDMNILEKNVKNISKNKNREIKCSEVYDQDYKYRKNIQKELREITVSIRGLKNVKYCSGLRALLRNCPSFGGQKFYETDTNDAGEFLQYLFSLFEVEGVELEKTVYLSNDIETNRLKKMKVSTSRRQKISPIFMIQSSFSENPIVLQSQIYTVDDAVFDKKNLVASESGGKFRRRIETTEIIDAEYIVFYDNRLGFEGRTNKAVIPSETLKIRNRELSLHSVVVHRNVHYTAYIKCNNKWYYYNDLSGINLFTDDFEYLLKHSFPNVCREGVLYFYS
jgi:hypothetical protein